MSDLRENIHRYMDIYQIKYYSDLLYMIGKELKVKDPYKFAEREKSNFSKMLKEERPLKHEFIIPLEKIFGVSMARLMDDGAYALPLDKEDMSYIKGFRYYAYKDDPKLYEDEFERTMVTNDGMPTICNSDEFNKTFLDYVVQYRSINALKFLLHKHGLKPYVNTRNTYYIDGKHYIQTTMDNQLYNMVIQEDDVELFDVLFNPFETCIKYDFPWDELRIELQTYEFILNSDKIFNSLFIPKEFMFKDFNRGIVGHDEEKITLLNPFINQCLDYALSKLDKYKERAKQILLFGIEYNKKTLEALGEDIKDLQTREYGCVFYKNSRELLTNIICPESEIADLELQKLHEQLSLPEHVERGY